MQCNSVDGGEDGKHSGVSFVALSITFAMQMVYVFEIIQFGRVSLFCWIASMTPPTSLFCICCFTVFGWLLIWYELLALISIVISQRRSVCCVLCESSQSWRRIKYSSETWGDNTFTHFTRRWNKQQNYYSASKQKTTQCIANECDLGVQLQK